MEGPLDKDGARPQIDVVAIESEDLAPAQRAQAASVTDTLAARGVHSRKRSEKKLDEASIEFRRGDAAA